MREQNLDVISRAAWVQKTTMVRKQQTFFFFCEFRGSILAVHQTKTDAHSCKVSDSICVICDANTEVSVIFCCIGQ